MSPHDLLVTRLFTFIKVLLGSSVPDIKKKDYLWRKLDQL